VDKCCGKTVGEGVDGRHCRAASTALIIGRAAVARETTMF